MNRLCYDACYTQERVRESTSPFMYVMNTNMYVNDRNCFPDAVGIVGGNPTTQTPMPALIDVESDLQGRDRPATKCSEFKYHPNPPTFTSYGYAPFKDCRPLMVDPSKFVPLPRCGVFRPM